MSVRKPASSASVALPSDGGKLHAPSAARNAPDLSATIKRIAPSKGRALELASGTGQHIVAFAAAMPGLCWQPSEVDGARLRSITTYMRESGLSNIEAPIGLDATRSGWSSSVGPSELICLSNLLHLISDQEAGVLISEAAKALTAGGKLVLYGPFKRAGKLISEGDVKFDSDLRANDPHTGYKDDVGIKLIAVRAALMVEHAFEMPANNLCLVFRKGA